MSARAPLSESVRLQLECEARCAQLLRVLDRVQELSDADRRHFVKEGWISESGDVRLRRPKHVKYLRMGLEYLPAGYGSLDASRPWIVYWIVHSLELLGASASEDPALSSRIVRFLGRCRSPEGGYGGGPQQHPHLAPTYASVLALATLGTSEALESIDRRALQGFIISLKHPSGGFRMHEDGEVDVRATYTALCVARLLNIDSPQLVEGTAEYVLGCQTFQGGFGGEPCNEAHGGYVFCAYASLILLGVADQIDLEAFEEWLANRQMAVEGGFQGRPNKLVDGCYSFWQGCSAALLEDGVLYGRRIGCWDESYWLKSEDDDGREIYSPDMSLGSVLLDFARDPDPHSDMDLDLDATSGVPGEDEGGPSPVNMYDSRALQRYIVFCAQHAAGGLRDKPDKYPDYYHTCYNLSGLSTAQHCLSSSVEATVVGDPSNRILPTNLVFNIRESKARRAVKYFKDAGPI
mmetsp:Transcript_2828/g.11543  ORF Transcript_2828/g.11543 Transcript_2828/m.11543 type:complete len:464 (-) Transcript_2828:1720-3111(-)